MQGSAFVKVGDVKKYINESGHIWLIQHMDRFKHVNINMRWIEVKGNIFRYKTPHSNSGYYLPTSSILTNQIYTAHILRYLEVHLQQPNPIKSKTKNL